MVAKCLLCLECPTIPGPKFLEIFGDEGLRLDISAIINKHFWLKANKNSEDVQKICMTCWEIVRDFHILYQRVEEVHRYLETKAVELDDPLPQDVLLKSENYPSTVQDPIMEENVAIFDSEVKVEVHDLDLLPQIEILETENHNTSEKTNKLNRRGRPSTREQSIKTSAKRIKKEQSPNVLLTNNITDDLSENDIEHTSSDALNTSGLLEDSNIQLLSSSLDTIEKEEGVSVKKRGRPRKGDTESIKANTTRVKRIKKQHQQITYTMEIVKNERDSEEEPSCSTAQTGVEENSEIKTEISNEEQHLNEMSAVADQFDDDAYVQDDFEDDDNYQKPSDESSNSDSESEDSNASDWADNNGKKEKFAVIKKKERNTPKKYKKRDKPLVEPKRMSREEIEARQAQQAEYDNIITKFFEKIRCPKCELLVHTFGEMRAHFRLDHNDDHGFVECCGRRFATRKFLAEHILVHYNPEHFKCKTCDKVCRDSTQLESHEQSHLPNPPSKYKKTFQCEKCSKTFSSKASFEHHMVAKHVPREEFKFECPECKKKFSTNKLMNQHYRRCHSNNLVCDICGDIVKSIENLSRHKRNRHGPKKPKIPKECTICHNKYIKLTHHMNNMHTDYTDKPNICEICGFVSTTKVAKYKHIKLKHQSEKKHKCCICEKAYKTPAELRDHMAYHTGVNLHKCAYCPMTFRGSSFLYQHCRVEHPVEFGNRVQKRLLIAKNKTSLGS